MNITNTNDKEKQPTTVKFTLNMPFELRKRLRLYCAQQDCTMSSLILALVESHLTKIEREPTYESAERWRRIQ